MRTAYLLSIALAAALLVGCTPFVRHGPANFRVPDIATSTKGIRLRTDPPQVWLEGIVLPTASGTHYHYIGFGYKLYPLEVDKDIKLPHRAYMLHLRVSPKPRPGHPYDEYEVLFGSGLNDAQPGEIRFNQTENLIWVNRGWIYLNGDVPISGSQRTAAAAAGTAYILQAAADCDYVILTSHRDDDGGQHKIFVNRHGDPPQDGKPIAEDKQDWFITVVGDESGGISVSDPEPLPEDSSAEPRRLRAHVEQAAKAAGMWLYPG